MKKLTGIMAVLMVLLMISALFCACGGNDNSGSVNYDGTYSLVEMTEGSLTLTKEDFDKTGAEYTLTINGDKATMKRADGDTNELQFDANAKTFTADGETIQATFEGNKCILENSELKMVFEK